jgi:hypothetical protein
MLEIREAISGADSNGEVTKMGYLLNEKISR